ncbi:MAG: GNAT family N-acetyltransferase [Candidatus Diapherotrites archaeon]|nr:GNAT family N-acetyltransferase [Candidatus Diapherotrites archaeon]
MIFGKARKEDLQEILRMVEKDFAYTGFDLKKLEKRLSDSTLTMFRLSLDKRLAGFSEIEFFPDGYARLNAISIDEKLRGKNLGKRLLGLTIAELKKSDVEKVFLLVKRENAVAKSIYSRVGFRFAGFHDSKIENSTVERMELELSRPAIAN